MTRVGSPAAAPPAAPPSELLVAGGGLVVRIAPKRGAKVVSLRGAGIEWLLQPGGQQDTGPAAGPFVAAGLSGWDECVPTIDPCALSDGTLLPDHGSVWSTPWRPAHGGWLTVDVAAPRLVFGRRVVPTKTGLRFEYHLRNGSASQVSALWAAHPQFRAPDGTRVVLAATDVVEVHPGTDLPVPWRETDCIDSVAAGCSRKVYLPADARVDSVRLERPEGGWLQLSWDTEMVPHLGVWFDRGRYAPEPVVALEPGIGWYDSLDRAIANGSAPTLPGHGATSWWLDLAVGTR